MTVEKELQKLAKLTEESAKETVAEQIKRIGEKEGEVVYQIIIMLTKERMERGHSKRYSLAELQKRLPWEKSRLIQKMQRIVTDEVLIHEKRKYQLNKENGLVKRIWNYYNEPNYQEKEKTEEIRILMQKKRKLVKELEKEEKKKRKKYREATKKEEEEFRKEIITEYEEGGEARGLVAKKTLEAIGYRRKE